MGAAYFYHLTQASIEQTLPMLLGKCRDAGWAVEVRGTDTAAIARLDAALWAGPAEGFLPHGIAGGQHDADQPILLTAEESGSGGAAANEPACVMIVQGAEVSADEVQAKDRVCILFDGHDDNAVAHARVQWKMLTGAGCSAQYWAQDAGRWEKKAEA